jgi:hypothetical protein
MTFGHLAEAMHTVLVALGGTPQVWPIGWPRS